MQWMNTFKLNDPTCQKDFSFAFVFLKHLIVLVTSGTNLIAQTTCLWFWVAIVFWSKHVGQCLKLQPAFYKENFTTKKLEKTTPRATSHMYLFKLQGMSFLWGEYVFQRWVFFGAAFSSFCLESKVRANLARLGKYVFIIHLVRDRLDRTLRRFWAWIYNVWFQWHVLFF